ncbi:NSP (nuclear shuttle protein)-interacting GTPase [Hibiscus trionum]|uniref:NSP (Nuclear shuttle protein)-interacting GTPase n=1 Tax=Hibiscus trionum TaxID=183268 RepID=A0A9W7I4V2_HIBTR|nr:NSP (nuclear shuttle protein)-interacting GTPase [Hibiscus trionum]
MASRVKEDEKNERIIRGLLKQLENRRCINCNSLGPQYVCTNFWTFVCTTCSGIHREFTHRVKSVSMAKFTSQEVAALQEGGNQRAKEIYFKEWDPQRNSAPNSSNVERLRDFIKHVYVDRRYSGERNYDKPPRGKMGDKEDFYENRRTDGYQGGSRSPPYEDTNDRRYSDRSSPGGRNDDRNSRYGYDEMRSPGYDQESRQYGDYRRSPARPEVVNDWRREDRFGNGRKADDHIVSDGDSKLEGRSPEHPKESSSPPVVRPIREILGENVIPLRVGEPLKANGGRTVDGPQTQRTASSSSLGSSSGNLVEAKLETTGSLIDFDADPEPPVAPTVTQTQQTTTTQSIVQPPASTNGNNWASFDFPPQTNLSQAPNVNTLDAVLSQLSVPASVPGNQSGVSSSVTGQVPAPVANVNLAPSNVAFTGQIQTLPFGAGAPASAVASNFSTLPPTDALTAAPGLTPTMPVSSGSFQLGVNNAEQWPNMQHQQTHFFSSAGSQSNSQQFMPMVDEPSTNQPWNFVHSQHMQGSLSASVAQNPQAASKPFQNVMSAVASQHPPAETKASGRQELPADLFTATYPTYHAATPGWQTAPPRGMGFAMQYNSAVPTSAFPQSSRSVNPFDLGGEAPQPRTQTSFSMASLQGALPNAPSSGLLRTSSLDTPSSAWMPPQSLPYASGMPSQSPPYASALPPMPYSGSQLPGNLPPSSLQLGGIGSEASYGFINTDHAAGRFSAPAANPQPFSSVGGGNPFG